MKKKNKELGYKADQLQLAVMGLPTIIFLIIFSYIPMFGLIIAFKDFKYNKGFLGSDFIGLKNFEFFFKSSDAFRVIRNTILYNLAFIVIGTVVAVVFAIMLSYVAKKFAVKYYQTTMFIPYFLSWVIVAYISTAFLDYKSGVLNGIIRALGFEAVSWYSEPKYWPFILVLFNIWKTVGYSAMVFYASIINIDSSVYEAARIDGCSEWKMITRITVPLIRSTIIMLTILSIGKVFRADFGLFYQLPQGTGALLPVTDVVDTYIYRALKVTGDIGLSSAVGFIQSIVGFILVVVTNMIVNKIDEQSALF